MILQLPVWYCHQVAMAASPSLIVVSLIWWGAEWWWSNARASCGGHGATPDGHGLAAKLTRITSTSPGSLSFAGLMRTRLHVSRTDIGPGQSRHGASDQPVGFQCHNGADLTSLSQNHELWCVSVLTSLCNDGPGAGYRQVRYPEEGLRTAVTCPLTPCRCVSLCVTLFLCRCPAYFCYDERVCGHRSRIVEPTSFNVCVSGACR